MESLELTAWPKDITFWTPMTMNPLPPQAYTKDTLTKAYMWLAHQNAHIKELATTPDILVSLFLKAQRNGDEALDTPSIQNFKNELKSLAGLMGELDNKQVSFSPPQYQVPPPSASATANFGHLNQHASTAAPAPQPQVVVKQMNIQNNHASPDLVNQLDLKSKAIISELREQLNLSSDVEVLRLLISLGYNKAKSLYS